MSHGHHRRDRQKAARSADPRRVAVILRQVAQERDDRKDESLECRPRHTGPARLP